MTAFPLKVTMEGQSKSTTVTAEQLAAVIAITIIGDEIEGSLHEKAESSFSFWMANRASSNSLI